MYQPVPTRILRIAMAGLMVLWMTGAGCLLGCERGLTSGQPHHLSTSSSFSTVVFGEACAAPSRNCCSRHAGHKQVVVEKPHANTEANAKEKFESLEADASGTLGNCPLAVNAFAVVAKVRHEKVAAAPTAVIEQLFSQNQNVASFQIPASLPLTDRGHTYLRCCTFLI